MKLFALKCLGLVVPLSLAAQTAVHKPILPLPPKDLLGFLPATPQGWDLKQSTAKNVFIQWLASQATREFQMRPNKSADRRSAPAITRIRLMDTGYFPTFNGDFENFRVGKYPGAESLVIGGMRARKISAGANHERLRVSVRGRFIVEVETENQPSNSGQGWLRFVDFPRINSITDNGAEQLPKPIILSSVDELTPTKNSTSKLFWGGPTPRPDSE